jgi:hypothetical protein
LFSLSLSFFLLFGKIQRPFAHLIPTLTLAPYISFSLPLPLFSSSPPPFSSSTLLLFYSSPPLFINI